MREFVDRKSWYVYVCCVSVSDHMFSNQGSFTFSENRKKTGQKRQNAMLKWQNKSNTKPIRCVKFSSCSQNTKTNVNGLIIIFRLNVKQVPAITTSKLRPITIYFMIFKSAQRMYVIRFFVFSVLSISLSISLFWPFVYNITCMNNWTYVCLTNKNNIGFTPIVFPTWRIWN